MSHPTRLKLVAGDQWVEATLETELTLDDLFDAEAAWAPGRIRMIQTLHHAGVPRQDRPESLHWNWALKADEIGATGFGGLSPRRVFGIRADGQWQGMLLGVSVGHPTRTERRGREQIYVDYVEIAPWNWNVTKLGHTGTYKGIGRQLVEMAVRWSRAEEFGGRISLHSLPQAEEFYRVQCGMTDLGSDTGYQGLRYFEMTEEQAKAFLMEDKP
jgi:hypothetical protein